MKSVIGYRTQSVKASDAVKKKVNFMDLVVKSLVFVFVGIITFILIGLLFSLPVMWLWNAALVPAIPGLAKIGWLQAWGILILCSFLFKPYINNNKD